MSAIPLARLPVGLLVLVLAVLTLYPLGMLFYGSLHTEPPGEPGELSFAGYRSLWSWRSAAVLGNTLGISLVTTSLAMVLALALAWIVARTDTPGRRTLEVLITLPFFLPPILTATAWGMLGAPRGGLINLAWTWLTGSEDPLVNVYSYGGVVWHMMQYSTPFLFLLFATALKTMDPALEESSRMSGASGWATFRRVTLGLVLPVTTSGFILAFIRGVEAFESPMFFGTPARIQVLTTEIYNRIHHDTEPDYQSATALAIVVVALLSLLIVWQWRILGSRSFLTVTGRGYRPHVSPLGRWRWVTFAFALAFIFVTVALPVGQLALGSFFRFFGFYQAEMLTFEHYREVWESRLFWRALSNTLLLGFGGATFTMLLGSLAAYVIVRTRSPARRVVEALAWLPWMMPGMVLGVGLLWAYAFLPGPIAIYGTRWALFLAYATLCIPLAVRTMAGAFGSIGADLEECSRVHGAGFWKAFRTILLSLSWPSFTVGWIFLFFIILRELSASILLYGPGSEVLSVVVMRLWSEGKAEEVSVIALVMLAFVLGFRFLGSRIVKANEVVSW